MVRDVLTQAEASRRARAVSGIAYDIALELHDAAEGHRGITTIACTVLDGSSAGDVWVDYAGAGVTQVEIDGRDVAVAWDGARLQIPIGSSPGPHRIRVKHRIAARRSGAGLREHVDPVDGRRYLSTMFEPFGAHRVFPCFDQPDLKAIVTLAVTAPPGWDVIANAPIAVRRRTSPSRRRTRFRPIGPISTYVVAIMAGELHRVRRRIRGLPVSYACRATLAPRLDDEVSAVHALVERGLATLESYLATPMPFDKLDHVFVPGYRDGAMENVGAIALGESFLFGDGASASQLAGRAEIVLHELAHLWLGDLVTMAWWDDLWLKESLATYLSFVALDATGADTNAWVRFEAGRKAEALDEDRRAGARAIVTPVPDTDAALLAGDDIAYGKGAAVLHQLSEVLGPSTFRDGVRSFVADHAWGTASLGDLLRALGAAADLDLGAWADAWLATPGHDTIAVEPWPAAGPGTVALTRTGSDGRSPGVRQHHLIVGLGTDLGGRTSIEMVPAVLAAARTEVSPPDAASPTFVVPDVSGRAYARVLLDDRSAAALRVCLPRIGEPLIRQIVWGGLWERVLGGTLRSTDFVAEALDAARSEPSPTIATALLRRIRTAVRELVPIGQAGALRRRAVDIALDAASGSDGTLARPWLRLAVDAAVTPEDVLRVGRAITDGGAAARYATPAMQWSLATAATAAGMPEAAMLADRAARTDADGAAAGAAAIDAARPDSGAKARAWRRIVERKHASSDAAEAAMAAFFRSDQTALVLPYAERYFAALEGPVRAWPIDDALAFVSSSFPFLPESPGLVERARLAVDRLASGDPVLARPLREAGERLEVAIRIRGVADATK